MNLIYFIRLFTTAFICIVLFSLFSCGESSTESDDGPSYANPVPPEFGNPQTVFTTGSSGSWDDKNLFCLSVLADGDTLRMWYNASSYNDGQSKIGYAWSLNGTDWNRYSGNPVMTKTFAWEENCIGQPVVIKYSSLYRMWYHVSFYNLNTQTLSGPSVVGYATSTDGIEWHKYENPVMEREPGTFTSNKIGLCSIMKENDMLHGWYYGTNGPYSTGNGNIGYATSSDGINWNKHGVCLSCSGSDNWDADHVTHPIVVKSDICYEMFYLGFTQQSLCPAVGYATSETGNSWVKYSQNPIISYNKLSATNGGIALRAVLCDWPVVGEYHLWYGENLSNFSNIRYIHGVRRSE